LLDGVNRSLVVHLQQLPLPIDGLRLPFACDLARDDTAYQPCCRRKQSNCENQCFAHNSHFALLFDTTHPREVFSIMTTNFARYSAAGAGFG